MKRIFSFLYRIVTESIHKEVEKSRVREVQRIMDRWHNSLRIANDRRKWDYSVMQLALKKNNIVHQQLLEEKLNKWAWLKKLKQ